MSEAIIKKNGIDYPLLVMPNHFPADRVYLDGDTSKTVQGAVDELAGKDLIRVTYSTSTDSISMATIVVDSSYKIVSVFSKRTYYIERYCINESNDYTAYVKLSDYNGTALSAGTNVDFIIYCIKA